MFFQPALTVAKEFVDLVFPNPVVFLPVKNRDKSSSGSRAPPRQGSIKIPALKSSGVSASSGIPNQQGFRRYR
jgi:hypothetical protein